MPRVHDRAADQLRPLSVTFHVFEYASGSVLYEAGKTKVLCAVTLQQGVPPFLRGKKTGWLTAEYAMLPTATQVRTSRESVTGKRNSRCVEISRFIGRALRAVVDLDVLGERTITIDCDVQQADGSTRVACVTGAYLALSAAQASWLANGVLEKPCLKDSIAAVSVGVRGDEVLLDIDCDEDTSVDADFNFVLTGSGRVVEMHGSVERTPLKWELVERARMCAVQGIEQIFSQTRLFLPEVSQPATGFPLAALAKKVQPCENP